MPNFSYTRSIPNPPNNPSQDVPNMQINTNSIMDLIATDHITFGQNNGGTHQQVQLKEGTLPPGLQTGFETLYSKVVTQGELFFTRGASGTEIQMTAAGNLTGAAPVVAIPGGTFLPGGLFMYWGNGVTIGTNTTLAFPFGGFPNNCFVCVPISNTGLANFITSVTFLVKTGFTVNTNSATPFINFSYIAIGN